MKPRPRLRLRRMADERRAADAAVQSRRADDDLQYVMNLVKIRLRKLNIGEAQKDTFMRANFGADAEF